jgi:hypothetical protein
MSCSYPLREKLFNFFPQFPFLTPLNSRETPLQGNIRNFQVVLESRNTHYLQLGFQMILRPRKLPGRYYQENVEEPGNYEKAEGSITESCRQSNNKSGARSNRPAIF